MTEWIDAVENADQARLEAPVREGADESWLKALAHTAIHTAYHIGQIVTIRKANGDWDPAQGVS